MTDLFLMENITLFVLALLFCGGDLIGLFRYWNRGEIAQTETSEQQEIICAPTVKLQLILAGLIVLFTGAALGFQRFFYHKDFFYCVRVLCVSAVVWPSGLIDYYEKRIPNRIILIGVVFWVIEELTELVVLPDVDVYVQMYYLLAGVIVFAAFALFLLLSRGGIGMGDVKLFALLAAFVGLLNMLPIVVFSLFVSFCAAIALLVTKKKTRKDSFAFGPCVVAGTVLSFILTSA